MRWSLLCVLCACSAHPPVPDAGEPNGPERSIASDDGAALLWVPAGAAPASADIHVTAIDGGYALTPSGLQFSRPAYLFHRLPLADGGVFYSASLKSSDGTVE